MRIIYAIVLLAFVSCSMSKIPSDVRALRGKVLAGVNLEEKYCKWEETASSNSIYIYMYFSCKDFTLAVNKRTQMVDGVYEGKK
jgi:hypothetical protein